MRASRVALVAFVLVSGCAADGPGQGGEGYVDPCALVCEQNGQCAPGPRCRCDYTNGSCVWVDTGAPAEPIWECCVARSAADCEQSVGCAEADWCTFDPQTGTCVKS